MVGATPWDWLLRAMVRGAQELLERTDWPVDRVATACGFQSTATFRHHFGRVTAVTPGRYRRTFGAGPASAGSPTIDRATGRRHPRRGSHLLADLGVDYVLRLE